MSLELFSVFFLIAVGTLHTTLQTFLSLPRVFSISFDLQIISKTETCYLVVLIIVDRDFLSSPNNLFLRLEGPLDFVFSNLLNLRENAQTISF